MGIEQNALGKIGCIEIFENASNLDVREGKGFRHVLHAARLHDQLVERFALEVNDGSIRMDGSCMDVYDVAPLLDERNFNVTVFPTVLGEDLDPEIDVLVGGESAVVTVDLAEKNDSWSAGCFWLAGHLQLIGRNGLETHRPGRRGEKIGKQKSSERALREEPSPTKDQHEVFHRRGVS